MGSKHSIGQVGVGFDLGVAEAHDGEVGLEVVFPLFADKLQHLGGAALLVAVAILEVFLGKVAVFVQRFAAGQLDLLPCAGGQRHLHITGDILPKVQHGLAVGRLQQLAGEGFVFQNRHGIHTGNRQVIAVGAHTVPAGQFTFDPCIVDLALLHIVLANRPALRCLHRAIGNADRFAVHLQLKQHAQRITEQVAVTVHAARAAVPAITESNQKLILALVQQRGHIVGLRTKMFVPGKAAGSQHHITNAHAVQPCRVQSLGRDIQPCLALGRRKVFAQVRRRAVGLIRLGCALARGFFFRLLALPVGAGKGVDGIIPGDVDRLGLGVHPLPCPVALCKAGFKACLTPRAGDTVFIPQAHAPAPAHAGAAHSRGISVHSGALHLAAVPNSLAVRGQFNFIGSLTHTVSTLPEQEQRPSVNTDRCCQMVGFKVYCSHRQGTPLYCITYYYKEIVRRCEHKNFRTGIIIHKSAPYSNFHNIVITAFGVRQVMSHDDTSYNIFVGSPTASSRVAIQLVA